MFPDVRIPKHPERDICRCKQEETDLQDDELETGFFHRMAFFIAAGVFLVLNLPEAPRSLERRLAWLGLLDSNHLGRSRAISSLYEQLSGLAAAGYLTFSLDGADAFHVCNVAASILEDASFNNRPRNKHPGVRLQKNAGGLAVAAVSVISILIVKNFGGQ